MSRFYLYDIGCQRWLIDTDSKTIDSFYTDCCVKGGTTRYGKKDINGLIKRYQHPVYMKNAYTKDYFVYNHFMDEKEKSECKFKPDDFMIKLIIQTDDIREIYRELLKEKMA